MIEDSTCGVSAPRHGRSDLHTPRPDMVSCLRTRETGVGRGLRKQITQLKRVKSLSFSRVLRRNFNDLAVVLLGFSGDGHFLVFLELMDGGWCIHWRELCSTDFDGLGHRTPSSRKRRRCTLTVLNDKIQAVAGFAALPDRWLQLWHSVNCEVVVAIARDAANSWDSVWLHTVSVSPAPTGGAAFSEAFVCCHFEVRLVDPYPKFDRHFFWERSDGQHLLVFNSVDEILIYRLKLSRIPMKHLAQLRHRKRKAPPKAEDPDFVVHWDEALGQTVEYKLNCGHAIPLDDSKNVCRCLTSRKRGSDETIPVVQCTKGVQFMLESFIYTLVARRFPRKVLFDYDVRLVQVLSDDELQLSAVLGLQTSPKTRIICEPTSSACENIPANIAAPAPAQDTVELIGCSFVLDVEQHCVKRYRQRKIKALRHLDRSSLKASLAMAGNWLKRSLAASEEPGPGKAITRPGPGAALPTMLDTQALQAGVSLDSLLNHTFPYEVRKGPAEDH